MSSVALILGAGPRIGAAVSEQFAASGYKVAIASRNGTGAVNDEGYLSLKADFSKPESISSVFEAVKSQLGVPSVVIYNAAALTPPPDQASALSIPADKFTSDFNVNTVSPYVSAQEAVRGWETLPKDVKKSFIYTGNILNVAVAPAPMMLNLGVGKAASAYWIGVADATYKAKGYRFFYADERTEEGQSKGQALDGPAHGDFYTKLAKQDEEIPWHATFSKGKGYVQFN